MIVKTMLTIKATVYVCYIQIETEEKGTVFYHCQKCQGVPFVLRMIQFTLFLVLMKQTGYLVTS